MYSILIMVLMFVVAVVFFVIGIYRYKTIAQEAFSFQPGAMFFIIGTIMLLTSIGTAIGIPMDQSYKANYWSYKIQEIDLSIEQTKELLAPYERIESAGQGVAAGGEGVSLKMQLSSLYIERNTIVKYVEFVNSGKNQWWIMGHINLSG